LSGRGVVVALYVGAGTTFEAGDAVATGELESAEGGINTGDVAVYTSSNDGDVNYVGITNNLERRAAEQLSEKGIEIDAIEGLTNLSRVDARAVEQVLIEEYGGPGNQLLNKINSIAQNNAIYEQSIQRGCTILTTIGYAAPNVCG
jgi:predicted GIY-YIG superfamily endonuclease